MTPTEQDKELREAIRKDFHQLLVKEFTADWKIQRIVRDLEIDVISLDNTMQLITANYTPINQPSTKITPVTDGVGGSESTNQSEHKEVK